MTKPIIVLVDDVPPVLNSLQRDLREHYGKDYQILKASSAFHAVKAVTQFKQRNAAIALFLVDQRMPEMTGTELLLEVGKLYPQARKALLTAYADTEAAVTGINQVHLDYYFRKPWDPPEEKLYPILDKLLQEWWTTVPLPFDGIRVAGTSWSPSTDYAKELLGRGRIPYEWLDLETNVEAQNLVEASVGERRELPVLFFPDGTVLQNPDPQTLAEKSGLTAEAEDTFYDLIVIGAGPAGLGAAVYGATEGFRTLLVNKEAAGWMAEATTQIEGYLASPVEMSGADLAQRAAAQAERLGADVLTQEVVGIRVEEPYRLLQLADGSELACRALLLATGVTAREGRPPGVERLFDAGVFYGAAPADGARYRGQSVVVLGGATAAGVAALLLSRTASKVTIVMPGGGFSEDVSPYLVDEIGRTENIEVLSNATITEAFGDDKLEGVMIKHVETGETETREVPGLFVCTGAAPQTKLVAGLVELDGAGFILTGPDLVRGGVRPKGWTLQRDPYLLETSVPGIFAAGSVQQRAGGRVDSAVAQGAIAASAVRHYLRGR